MFAVRVLLAIIQLLSVIVAFRDLAPEFEILNERYDILDSIASTSAGTPIWVIASGIFICVGLAWVWLELQLKRARFQNTMNLPHGWSLTFYSSTELQFIRGPYSQFGDRCRGVLLKDVRIFNLSQRVTRIADTKLRFRNREYAGEPITLPSVPFSQDGVGGERIELGPGQSFTRDLEFSIPPEFAESFCNNAIMTTDLSKIEFIITESVSGKTKIVLIGEIYDAASNRVRIKRRKRHRYSLFEYRTPGL